MGTKHRSVSPIIRLYRTCTTSVSVPLEQDRLLPTYDQWRYQWARDLKPTDDVNPVFELIRGAYGFKL